MNMKLKFTFIFKAAAAMLVLVFPAAAAQAQERPYFVTYSHDLEEPGALEVAVNPVFATQRGAGDFLAGWTELEYGVKGWWTTEFYLEGVAMRFNGNGFTGWRWENRFHPLKGEHAVNPVLYLEYESINEASRIQKEIVGSGALSFAPIDELRASRARELEAKLGLQRRKKAKR